jgi:mannosyltransferase
VAMAKNKKKYGFVISLWEKGETVPSLFRKISDYKKAHKIPTTNLWKAFIDPSWAPFFVRPFLSLLDSRDKNGDMWNMCHYWSNFEIADMDWYRSPEYRQLFDMLDADGGFYYERV